MFVRSLNFVNYVYVSACICMCVYNSVVLNKPGSHTLQNNCSMDTCRRSQKSFKSEKEWWRKQVRTHKPLSFYLFFWILHMKMPLLADQHWKQKMTTEKKVEKYYFEFLYSKVKKATTTKEKKETDIKFQEVVSFDFLTQTKEW